MENNSQEPNKSHFHKGLNHSIMIDNLINSVIGIPITVEAKKDCQMLKITGESVLPKDKVKAFLTKKNPVAPLWIIDLYYDVEKLWGIRADVLICQMFHETGYLTSWWSAPERKNMAGIGVTGETSKTFMPGYEFDSKNKIYKKGYSYSTYVQAVQAHFAHMEAYVNSVYVNEAVRWDARYDVAFMVNRGKPPIIYVTQLNGRWAMSNNYGESIEGIYNAIVKS